MKTKRIPSTRALLLQKNRLEREKENLQNEARMLRVEAREALYTARECQRKVDQMQGQRKLVQATKWNCNESNSQVLSISMRVPNERWLDPHSAEMAMAYALEQIGHGIGSKMREMSLNALKVAMTKPSLDMYRAKREFMMSLAPSQMCGLSFDVVDRMWEACLNAIKNDVMQ